MASTARVKRFAQKRKEAGWVYLATWLNPESAMKLEQICAQLNVTKSQAIERLLAES